MKKRISRGPGGTLFVLVLAMLWCGGQGASRGAVVPQSYTVLITVKLGKSPPQIVLSWPSDSLATGYTVYKKDYGSSTWVKKASLGNSELQFSDGEVEVGKAYEYQVTKSTSEGFTGYGYALAAIELPLVDDRGRVILIVEKSIALPLAQELARLEQDLAGDGWTVLREDVAASASPPEVKQIITSIYNQDPSNTKALFLFGHVPVPYSGFITPDEHDNHRGAWPTDIYYADIDGPWTDTEVDTTSPEKEWNWNVPGDGKFDQSLIPSQVELTVGRVDLSRMTCYLNKTPSRTEVDLLRLYLDKDHRFRHRQVDVPHKALIFDRQWLTQPEPLTAFAFRNLYPLFGAAIDRPLRWQYLAYTKENSYLFSTVTSGGSFVSADDVGTSDDFATATEVNAVFTSFCGSYYGDWDNESAFLRAALGASGTVLTTCYAGKPQWLFFPMAIGETIGQAARLTQHNRPNGLYPPFNPGTGQVHITLLGDPTLRMQPVVPPALLTGKVEGNTMRLGWQPSKEPNLIGYHVYKSPGQTHSFDRMTTRAITGTSYEDAGYTPGDRYMVRAIVLSNSGTATYWNASQGTFYPNLLRQQTAETPPEAPAFLVMDDLRADRITLRWLAGSANQDGFRIERKIPGQPEFEEIAVVNGAERSFSDTSIVGQGTYSYRICAFNNFGVSPYSIEVSGSTILASVEFNSEDRATSGNWMAKFGAEGSLIVGKLTNMPPYVSITTSNVAHRSYAKTTDPRGLLLPGEEERGTDVWSSGYPFALDVTLSDGKPHRFSIYMVDWSQMNRSFRIDAWDLVRQLKLDSREVATFTNGIYLSYDIINRTRFVITPTSQEVNMAVYGVFLDPSSVAPVFISPEPGAFAGKTTVSMGTPTSNTEIYYTLDGSIPDKTSERYTGPFTIGSSVLVKAKGFKPGYIDSPVASSQYINTLVTRAGFISSDGSTVGNWRGVYGKEGYNIRLGAVNLPSYASLNIHNYNEWYWSDNTQDHRALYKGPDGDTRVAAVWYAPDELTLDLNVIDTKSRAVALYFLDWDFNGRQQKVQVIDPDGKVLQEQVISNFQNGLYLVYNIQGSVKIKLTRITGNNAILNGIFFDPAPAELSEPGPIRFAPVLNAARPAWKISADAGAKVAVESSDNLKTWTSAGEFFIPAEGFIYEPGAESECRFFRCRLLP